MQTRRSSIQKKGLKVSFNTQDSSKDSMVKSSASSIKSQVKKSKEPVKAIRQEVKSIMNKPSTSREYKTICGVANLNGKPCKTKKANGLSTCLIHSGDLDIICGELTKDGKECKHLKDKCKFHQGYKPEVKEPQLECIKRIVSGDRCSKPRLPNKKVCWYHSLQPDDLCGAESSNGTCGQLKGKCVYHD